MSIVPPPLTASKIAVATKHAPDDIPQYISPPPAPTATDCSQTAFVFDVRLAGFDVGVNPVDGATYVVGQELHDEGGHAAVDADEEVDAGEDHVRRAGHAEDKGRRVHQRNAGPAADDKKR